jgi:putative peptidoglycan lipid II flippase
LGIFAVAISTAALPALSRMAAKQDIHAFKDSLAYAINLVLVDTVPAMFGLIILRTQIVALIYQHGHFSLADTQATAFAVLFFAISIPAIGISRVLVAAFNSLQDTKTPVLVAIGTIGINLLSSFILMRPLVHGGLALAVSLSSIFNFSVLTLVLRHRIGALGLRSMIKSGTKTFVASGLMSIVLYKVVESIHWTTSSYHMREAGLVLGIVFLGLVLFIVFSLLIGHKDVKGLIGLIKGEPQSA